MAHRRTRWTALLLAALLVGPGVTGCAYFEELNPPLLTESGERLPADRTEGTAGQPPSRAYPEDVEQGEPLNIEVIRVDNAIRLVNRTVRIFKDAELWLNHEYGAPLSRIGTGKTQPISLRSFINEHGERYPVGRFLAPDIDEALVEADLIVNGVAHPLPVRLQEGWDEPSTGP